MNSVFECGLAFFMACFVVSECLVAQEETVQGTKVECTVDLSKPGIMSDILSNALNRGFEKDSKAVRAFLDVAQDKYETGDKLLQATAKQFEIKIETLKAAVEDYKHCNCTHVGGGAFRKKTKSLQQSDGQISTFAENVLVHVVLHELGHGLVREFDLPILANEETLADTFATHYIVSKIPDRALDILEARISSLMIEANENPRTQWTVQGEHNSDARRAYQIAAAAIAFDPEKYAPLAKLVDMSESQMRKAADYGSEIHRSWRRILKPLWMPEGMESSEARTSVDSGSVFSAAISQSKCWDEINTAVKSFDWHSQVTVSITSGEGGAAWSRSNRRVTVHDEYIHRFNLQGKLFAAKADQ